jgi:hypothetical protein
MEQVTIAKVDFDKMCKELIKLKNENFLLQRRVEVLENVVRWCMNYLTFVYSFAGLMFFNGQSISSLIFNHNLLDLPFYMLNIFLSHLDRLADEMESKKDFAQREKKRLESEFMPQILRVRSDYDQFAQEFNSTDLAEAKFVDMLGHFDNDRARDKFVQDLEKLARAHNLSFSKSYLIKQLLLSQILMQFATSIFAYVPQLKVDFLRVENLAFTVDNYVAKVQSFWQTQTNLCIGQHHFSYQIKNMPGDEDTFVKNLLDITRKNMVDDFQPETIKALQAREFRPIFTLLPDPTEQRIDLLWRNVFLKSLDKVDTTLLSEQNLRKMLVFMNSTGTGAFEKMLVNRIDAQCSSTPTYLSNLNNTFYHQACICRLAIQHLLIQNALLQASKLCSNCGAATETGVRQGPMPDLSFSATTMLVDKLADI